MRIGWGMGEVVVIIKVQVIGFLSATCETYVKFSAPVFSPGPDPAIVAIWRVGQ